ncbi:MAG: FtsW/RodA/SpoVE family cell cycle protein [Chitinophagaceae bacterium]|jgi:cell division protein FtsW|nr:FtsW/RodA/SpoVE family cell cycle protein [Chitinophagaceae bacterium]MBK7678898.1 FtsW/RodA/SpoVE family cell cycle protein [Chitinophagaceae bacterium]MBK8299757.1 FtsW/RodA/SpoVE family cell cycle protein [Chitinophagaceae bacterium]MBK9659079.1 FtsW/RodA/SpoVE family cell cycle protein [Chitinophagaceae bacterium]MBK9937400.1 FtsW/RodA/SpoVE family cell cycle protein [Chitinophagaceae bacterium]
MEATRDIGLGGLKNTFNANNLISKTKGDRVIWALVVLLTLVSLLAVYSATGSLAYKNYRGNTEIYLFKQIAFILAGIMVIYFAHLVNYTFYSKAAKIAFLISLPLLFYTLFFGVKMNEGSRWIRLPLINMTMQTSDFARLALFMYLARLISKKQDVIKDFKKGYLPILAPVVVTCALIAPANLSTALLLGASCLLLMFIGRVSTRHILITIGVALIPIVFLISAAVIRHGKEKSEDAVVATTKSSSTLFGRVDTWIGRMESFIYGSRDDINSDAYQVNQAKIAIAKGGVFGVGPGNSTTRDYLPQAYNDFIYAIIIEEYGLMGGAFIMFIYLVFLYRCIRIYKRCPFAFGAFLALGLSFTLAIQAVANMAVTVNLFPVTGVTLPLVSMGGTSFIFTCLAIGIILSVSRNVEQLEGKAAAEVVK